MVFLPTFRNIPASPEQRPGLPRLRAVRVAVRAVSRRLPLLRQDAHHGKGARQALHTRLGSVKHNYQATKPLINITNIIYHDYYIISIIG